MSKVYSPLPHQEAFIRNFLSHETPHAHVLNGAVGTGKSYTAMAIAQVIAANCNDYRILTVAPRQLLEQLSSIAREIGKILTIVVDRQRYRELEAAVPVGQTPWQQTSAYFVGHEFASRGDILTSIVAVDWDLVIIDEGHRARATFLERICEKPSYRRLLILSATFDVNVLFDPANRNTWSKSDISATQWSKSDTSATQKLIRNIIPFERSRSEQEVLDYLRQLFNLTQSSRHAQLFRAIVLHTSSSSLNALEGALFAQLATVSPPQSDPSLSILQHHLRTSDDSQPDDELPETALMTNDAIWIDRDAARVALIETLEVMDGVATDSKLDALLAALKHLRATCDQAICVISSFTATVAYLGVAIAEAYQNVYQVTAADAYEMREQNRLEAIRSQGSLVASFKAIEGIDLHDFRHAFFYDLTYKDNGKDALAASFTGVASGGAHKLYAFRDSTGAREHEIRALQVNGFV